MKRTERHKLKENPLATWVAETTATLQAHARAIGIVAALVVLGGVVAFGYTYWREQAAGRAGAALAAALTISEAPVVPPQAPGTPEGEAPPAVGLSHPSERARLEAALPAFLAVVEQHPGTTAAKAALYHAAATLGALGRFEEAEARYLDVIAGDAGGIYGQMAELGRAGVLVAQGQRDEAIAVYEALAAAADSRVPVDSVLMQLARAYAAAERGPDAARAYQRIIDEFPQSAYAADATKGLADLKTRQS